jgi:serine/threonine protein kinase
LFNYRNILIDENDNLKLADFGVAKTLIASITNSQVGTINYWAPEIFKTDGYDQKTDVWASAVTFYQIITGSVPFYPNSLDTTPTPKLPKEFSNLNNLFTK